MCENEGFSTLGCNDTNNADMSFKIDFNFEPPQYKLIKKPVTKIAQSPVRNLSASDKLGNLLIYDNTAHYFLNINDQIIYNKSKLSYFAQSSSALMFPTNNDSIYLIVSVLDTLIVKNKTYGEIYFKKSIFNSIQKKFTQEDLPIDFGLPFKYNPFKHFKSNLRTGFACHIFNQIYDEKNDKYFLYFNLGDSIYISEYHKETMIFDAPKTSGLIISGRGNRNEQITINFGVFGADDIIHSVNNDFILHQNNNTERLKQGNYLTELTLYNFDKNNRQFYNPIIIDSVRFLNGRFTSKIFAPCDSILYYFFWSYNGNKNKLIKIVLNKSLNKVLFKYEYLVKNLFIDMKLAPNGKIVINEVNNRAEENKILFIKNPDDPTNILKLTKSIDYSNNLNISCSYNRILFFPNTPGLHKRVDFTYRSNCKKNSVLFTNNSDSFWFKRFTYYMGNGDSVNTTINQKEIVYHYSKSGKYWVKLKAFTKDGGWVWFSDSIVVQTAPNAYFSNQTTKGCQYIAFQFKDSSTVFQIKKDSAVRHAWHFGDGNSNYWQTFGLNIRKNQNHTYFQNGKYTVTHTVSDGYCTDSFSRINEVNILPAPKPGIDASPMSGCVPFSVRLKAKYPDTVDSSYWQSTAGHTQSTKNQIDTSFTFTQAGSFKIFHTQYGPTGCITSDTIEINAIMGINTQSSPLLFAATVLNNENALLYWQNVPFANGYQIFKNNLPIANTQDSFFIDQTNTNAQSYLYQVKATDVCLQKTQLSNQGKTILLTAKKASVELAVLQWSPYLNWANGVKDYTILEVKNQNDLFIHQTKDSSYKDANFLENGAIQKCYKILATQNGNTSIFSESNTVCLNYESIVWLPTAITINGDGINEVFKISTFGIKSYTISIFNRWGEKVFESNNPDEEWRPKAQEQGVYMYVFKAKTNNGDYITKGTITILR